MHSKCTVPREWSGETAFLLGGGPSLRGFDPEVIRGCGRIIAINNSYELCPWADVLYYCDSSWWKRHRIAALRIFTGKYRISIGTSEDDTLRIQPSRTSGLSQRPGSLCHGGNSGYQAIGLAYLFGASRIVLLGYDMRVVGERSHWHDGHPGGTLASQQNALQEMFLPHFASLVEPLQRAGVEVINATPGSALTCWPHRPLGEILNNG